LNSPNKTRAQAVQPKWKLPHEDLYKLNVDAMFSAVDEEGRLGLCGKRQYRCSRGEPDGGPGGPRTTMRLFRPRPIGIGKYKSLAANTSKRLQPFALGIMHASVTVPCG
jgi:hypothetical protein